MRKSKGNTTVNATELLCQTYIYFLVCSSHSLYNKESRLMTASVSQTIYSIRWQGDKAAIRTVSDLDTRQWHYCNQFAQFRFSFCEDNKCDFGNTQLRNSSFCITW